MDYKNIIYNIPFLNFNKKHNILDLLQQTLRLKFTNTNQISTLNQKLVPLYWNIVLVKCKI